MSIEEAVARARAIAAKLGGGGTDLGKRKFEDAYGLGALKKKKVYIPDNPSINFLGLLIGPRGSTQKMLQEKTGAKILVRGKGSQKDGFASAPDDDDDLHVSIEGPESAVDAAVREVEQILFNPEEAMRLKEEQLRSLGGDSSSYHGSGPHEEMKVPNALVGYIIGRGGENIQKLQFQTGATMQIMKESDMKPGDTHRIIILKGTPEAIADIRSKIEDVVSQKIGSKGTRELDHLPIVMKVPVPNDRVGYVIGKGGINVKNIQEKTRTTIIIPQDPDADDPSTRTISVGAERKQDAEAAHSEIYQLLQQHSGGVGVSGGTMIIHIPDDKVGSIIGRGGVTIKDVQARHQVRIQIPNQPDPGSNPPVRLCSITGPTANQEAARYEIEMMLQGQNVSQWGAPAAAYGVPWTAAGYDPSTLQQYAGYYGQAAATGAAAPTDAAPTDPTAYYNDFWQYASYYGEAAARAYYQAWSPPQGTAPPPGIVLPAAVAGAATATTTIAPTTTEPTSTTKAAESTADGAASSTTATSAADAWEAYKKQYSEWYEAHGKYTGADPNPPAPQ